MRKITLLTVALFTTLWLGAQDIVRDSAYVKTIDARSQSNVDKLSIADPSLAGIVKQVIVNHYYALNDIYGWRDTQLAKLKTSTLDKEQQTIAKEGIVAAVDSKLYRYYFGFLAELGSMLSAEKVEQVKDVLTYNVLNVTYKAQCEMIPSLTEPQKSRIYSWLVEAREYAVCAESSKKKHEVFGKYKGRINNYLSKNGYDLVRERDGWYKRIAAQKNK